MLQRDREERKQETGSRGLTSTKKTKVSNKEGRVFNLLSFISNKSPLHLFRISVDRRRKTVKQAEN